MAALALAACAALGIAACAAPAPREEGPRPAERERYARYQIGNALAFRAQGRLEAAEHALDAALATDPGNARARRLMAVVMEELGRLGEAERQRARADALDPPPPLPPDEPLASGRGLLVVVPPPHEPRGRDVRVAGGWPGGAAVEALLRRLRTRLPEAELVTVDPETSGEVQALLRRMGPRAVLSLRIDRAWCGDNPKDGPFSVAWLRVAAATPAGVVAAPEVVRHVEWIPPPRHCVQLPLARALEEALARPGVREALAAPGGAGGAWPPRAVRTLFPGLAVRIAAALEEGRARLATGRLNDALASFERAAEIDPHDADVRAYVQEAELTLAMARELAGDDAPRATVQGDLEPQLTAAQRAAARQLLAEERSRRDALLAALQVLDASGRAPSPQALGNLRSVPVARPDGPGARLAGTLHPGPFEVRAYFAPDGDTLARYWIPEGGERPVLREEDLDGDGALDRWHGYVDGARVHLWEDRQGLGWPDLHMTFAPDGAVERIEVDGDGDRDAERVFRYEDGVLASESRDTDDDGTVDRLETFDAEGFVVLREEDLDGDGEPDLRSHFERGRLVRREILNPGLLDDLTGGD